jgi:dihydroorotate dehydrogenase
MNIYSTFRPALFQLPPELAHRLAIRALQMGLVPASGFAHPSLATQVGDITLPNPVGLAAGFDKNAECFDGCLSAGFGFVEVGTVTPRAQAGNPRPRMFRLVDEEAVINRLGFNNQGVLRAARRLAGSKAGIVGGNIGKNKDSDNALDDYRMCLQTIYPHVDYITVNISSPNTPGLRDLQSGDALRALVRGLHAEREILSQAWGKRKPIWVKIAPDNDDAAFEAIADVALSESVDALIISNTTIDRDRVANSPYAPQTGGLSGKPLLEKSTQTLREIYSLTQGKLPLVGVGGIASAADAYAKIRAGASAIQLYTALVYQGFGLVEEINRGLVELLARDGFVTIQDAVGR